MIRSHPFGARAAADPAYPELPSGQPLLGVQRTVCCLPLFVRPCVQDVGMEVGDPSVRWWAVRRAQNSKPVTYRCPFCGKHLPALSEHMLIAPEGDTARRRHAHTKCVLTARKAGRLPSRDEWRATQPRRPGFLARLLRRA
jgi:hypothetical protein